LNNYKKIKHGIRITIAALTILALTFSNAIAQGDFDLQYSKNETSTYDFKLTIKTNLKMGPNEIKSETRLNSKVDYSINLLHQNSISHDMGFSKISLNTRSDATGSRNVNLKELIGVSFIVESDAHGMNKELMNAETYPVLAGGAFLDQHFMKFITAFPTDGMSEKGTWESTDEYALTKAEGSANVLQKNKYKLVGEEVVEDFNCVTIENNFEKDAVINMITGGRTIEIISNTKGTEKIYFAFEEGKIIKISSRSTRDLTTNIGSTALKGREQENYEISVNK